MEPSAGERCEVDWGHFGALDYAGDKRKLYAFALVECHSRMLYLEFTHSQSCYLNERTLTAFPAEAGQNAEKRPTKKAGRESETSPRRDATGVIPPNAHCSE